MVYIAYTFYESAFQTYTTLTYNSNKASFKQMNE